MVLRASFPGARAAVLPLSLTAWPVSRIPLSLSCRDASRPHAVASIASATTATTATHFSSTLADMLVARELTKSFPSGDRTITVLRDVSFTIADGAFVAIVGPSGSGKTTLLGLLAGLDTPSAGSVLLDDVDLAALNEDARAKLRGEKVGFVFQSFQLIPTLTALENVRVPLDLRGDDSALARATDLLARVGLADRMHHY